MKNYIVIVALAIGLGFAADAAAQGSVGPEYYGGSAQPAPAAQPSYDTNGDSYYNPVAGSQPPAAGYGAPAPQPVQPQPTYEPQPPPPAAAPAPPAEEAEGEPIRGFELGVNWAGGAKVSLEPGIVFGRVGLFFLAGLDLAHIRETAKTDDTVLGTWSNPTGGGTHDPGEGEYDESVTLKTSLMNYDLGMALRFYLLDVLREQKPSLTLELGLGWRGAVVKNTIDWSFTGDEDALGDVNGDGEIDEQDEEDLAYSRNKEWNRRAEDYANDAEHASDGLYLNLGLGGEYVFKGGFGIAAEAGLSLFWNTPWTQKGPYGYDDDASMWELDWEYQEIDDRCWEIEFGFYYTIAFRYHF